MPCLVIGIGNTLRSDDGLGWYAAQRLERILPAELAEVMVCHQLDPELAETISRAGLVVFIDASAKGTPGELRIEEVEPGTERWGAFYHHLDPPGILACARDVFGACPPGKVVSVAGEEWGLGEALSATVAAKLDEVVAKAQEIVTNFAAKDPSA